MLSALTSIAHAGEDHSDTAEAATSWIGELQDAPFLIALGASILLIALFYALLTHRGVKLFNRFLALLPLVLGLSVFFYPGTRLVSELLLASGFGLVLLITVLSLYHAAE